MTSSRTAAVTIDVDAVRHYHAIHGLPAPAGSDPILERGVRRFLEVCARVGVTSTIFVVGEDLVDDSLAQLLREAARGQHEIASHSQGHRYDLSRCSPAEIEADVLRSVDSITAAVGTRPVGFRAPGYNLSESLFDALEKAGFAYDSSLMPSPGYFALRAAAIGAHTLMRSPSSSIVGSAREFTGPRRPYRPRKARRFAEARSRVEGRDLVEIPIATLPLRLPWLGTSVVLTPSFVGLALAALAATSSPCVLELHPIDLCDADDGFSDDLVRLRTDLRVPVRKKLERIESVLRVLAQSCDVLTLEEIARGFSADR